MGPACHGKRLELGEDGGRANLHRLKVNDTPVPHGQQSPARQSELANRECCYLAPNDEKVLLQERHALRRHMETCVVEADGAKRI
jgi:hypothetical protein